MHHRRVSEMESFADQPIKSKDTKHARFKLNQRKRVEIVDSWMNSKWATLIHDSNASPNTMRVDLTNGMLINRSLMTSHYSKRK